MLAALREQLPRLVTAMESLTPDQLQQIVDDTSDTTLHYDVVHALHDEANHQGEIWLLRKMFTKRT